MMNYFFNSPCGSLSCFTPFRLLLGSINLQVLYFQTCRVCPAPPLVLITPSFIQCPISQSFPLALGSLFSLVCVWMYSFYLVITLFTQIIVSSSYLKFYSPFVCLRPFCTSFVSLVCSLYPCTFSQYAHQPSRSTSRLSPRPLHQFTRS